jgi:hypothetical protein
VGDSQAALHQHAPKIKNNHTSSPLGVNLLLWEAKILNSILKFKSNTSLWAGHHIYFNLWNSHGWSPLEQGWFCPDSTHLAGGPKTENRPDWPLPSSQVSLPTAKRWQQKQNTRIQKWPICSQVHLSSHFYRRTHLREQGWLQSYSLCQPLSTSSFSKDSKTPLFPLGAYEMKFKEKFNRRHPGSFCSEPKGTWTCTKYCLSMTVLGYLAVRALEKALEEKSRHCLMFASVVCL